MSVPPSEHFSTWEYEKAAKRKGGRVYIDVRANGEVTFHEGYVSRKEAAKARNGGTSSGGDTDAKQMRPEVSGPMQTYIDLHRHAAVRADLLAYPGIALRLMVAHACAGSSLWRVAFEPRTARDDAIAESAGGSAAEAAFDAARRALLPDLDLFEEEPTLTGHADDARTVALFLRLVDLPDETVMAILSIVMGETLASASVIVEAVGTQIGTSMAHWWQADDAFFDTLRDREVLGEIVAEVAGDTVSRANAKEKGKTLKAIIRAHLDGSEGRTKVEHWVPRWMRFAPSAYTARGGVGTVTAAKTLVAIRVTSEDDARVPDPEAARVCPEPDPEPDRDGGVITGRRRCRRPIFEGLQIRSRASPPAEARRAGNACTISASILASRSSIEPEWRSESVRLGERSDMIPSDLVAIRRQGCPNVFP